MHFFNAYIFIMCYQLLPSETQKLYAACRDHNNKPGQCLQDYGCPSFNRKLKDENFIKCDYNTSAEIICCPKVIKKSMKKEPKSLSISEKMCLKYSKFNFENKRYHPSTKSYPSCGFKTRKYIVGGTVTNSYEFPHMALISTKNYNNDQHICGGSLISDRFILTAAHCITSYNAKKYEVHLGQMRGANTNVREKRMRKYDVQNIILHYNYTRLYRYNDIALLELNQKVTFSKFIHPACLPEKKPDTPKVILSGYGRTGLSETKFADKLLKVSLKLQNIEKCKLYYFESITAPDGLNETTQLCFGDGNITDACTGDSGGPLQIYNLQFCTYTIVGIISYGKGCAMYPSIATNVFAYKEWIESIIYKNENNNIKNKSKNNKKKIKQKKNF